MRDLAINAIAAAVAKDGKILNTVADRMMLGESVVAPHPVVVLEHAAKAETPIGRSVTEFLMTNAAKIAAPSSLELPEVFEADPYEKRCRVEFGEKPIRDAEGTATRRGLVAGWSKMTWRERHELLSAKKETESPWA